MEEKIALLSISAASIGFFHTLLGPDHYLPFIVMAKARRWSMTKTALLTLVCGIGHVGSSVVLGFVGVALGLGISKLEAVEGTRGDMAAWAFIIFGFLYMAWGVYRAFAHHQHSHVHGATLHEHEHTHLNGHDHEHASDRAVNMTPWVLIVIFVLGPCEPLIPHLMYPAAENNILGVIQVAGIFSLVTVSTMLAIVMLAASGLNLLPLGKLERYTHALAGAAVFLSGCAIVFLGL